MKLNPVIRFRVIITKKIVYVQTMTTKGRGDAKIHSFLTLGTGER